MEASSLRGFPPLSRFWQLLEFHVRPSWMRLVFHTSCKVILTSITPPAAVPPSAMAVVVGYRLVAGELQMEPNCAVSELLLLCGWTAAGKESVPFKWEFDNLLEFIFSTVVQG